jgi:hypothetical protein
MSFISKLDAPLLKLSKSDDFTLRDACNGVHIFGAIGSGKTSGSGQALAGAYLRAGMGGLVLCAKPEEVKLWQRYAKEHGRSNSVVVFDESQGFNFITYELARQGMQGISNVTECLMRVIEAADHASGVTGGKGEDFWEKSMRLTLNYAIPVIYAAHGTVTIADIISFVSSAATRVQQYDDDAWMRRSYAAQTLGKCVGTPVLAMDAYAIKAMKDFWFQQYPAIPEKTRGSIIISLSSCLDRFKHGRLRQTFCDRTTLVPELTFHGAIIIMNMPALTWNEDGIIGQQLFKFMWQRAVESRNGLDQSQSERPVFLWADEAQYFVNLKDDDFLSTCRGSKACVVFLTQTLPTYYARLGKDNSDAADGLVGKFNTQIFHLNACNRTNTFASQLVGRGLQIRNTTGSSYGSNISHGVNQGGNAGEGSNSGGGNSFDGLMPAGWSSNRGQSSNSGQNWGHNVGRGSNENVSYGTTEQMDFLIEPRVFANDLKSGGPKNKNKVTAVWLKAGARFQASAGANTLITTFEQPKQ